MKILFLGDIVGVSGCEAVKKFLPKKIEENKIDFVIAVSYTHLTLPTILLV